MKQRVVSGKTEITSDGNITFYSDGNIVSNGTKVAHKGDENGVKIGHNPEKQKVNTSNHEDEDGVNVYIGMFFDGTGNNMKNSEAMYYAKLQNGMIKGDDIPQAIKHTVNVIENGQTIKKTIDVTDRDSYWNPYSNVAKLFQLYKEEKKIEKKAEFGGRYVILKQYIEGIGTKENEPDDILGSGLARGSWGVLARVEEGIEKVVEEQIKKNLAGEKINKIVFDVFGFSRGAAAARHFCNEVKEKATYSAERIRDPYDPKGIILTGKQIVSKHAGGYLGRILKKNNIKHTGETYTIEIRFLGVFDTVVSDMIVKDNLGYKASLALGPIPAIFQLSLDKIKTNLSGLGIGYAFHIVAQDEWRENFSLTHTNTGYTLSLLGTHSDIGGGYAELDKYNAVVDYFDLKDGDKATMEEKEKVRQFYINNYFCNENEIKFVNTYDHYIKTEYLGKLYGVFPIYGKKEVKTEPNYYHDNKAPQIYDPKIGPLIMDKESDHYIIKDSRYISNKYSLVPMNLMFEKALEKNVPFYKTIDEARDIKHKEEYDFSSHNILKEYLEKMKTVIKEENNGTYHLSADLYRTIRNKYIHLSAHYGGLKNDFLDIKTGDHHILSSVGFVNQPVKYSIEADTANYKRGLYENK